MCKKRGKGRIFKKGGEKITSRLFINFDFFSFFCFTTQSEPDLYSSSTICSLLSLECQGEWKRWKEREGEKNLSSSKEDFAELDVVVLFEETERDSDGGPQN